MGAMVFTTATPTALQTIGWKLYLVFIACNIGMIVFIYFYVPETTNLSLEEMGDLFGDDVIVHQTADGHAIIEDDKLAHASVAGSNEGIRTETIPASGAEKGLLPLQVEEVGRV